MTESIALAIAVPAALGAAWLASRRSWSPAAADSRGIALQTVIVIVVMLVIAGGVAGVLLNRGSEVTADLQNQDVVVGAEFTDEASCDLLFGAAPDARSTYAAGPPQTCTFTGDGTDQADAPLCTRLGGQYNNVGNGVCTLTR